MGYIYVTDRLQICYKCVCRWRVESRVEAEMTEKLRALSGANPAQSRGEFTERNIPRLCPFRGRNPARKFDGNPKPSAQGSPHYRSRTLNQASTQCRHRLQKLGSGPQQTQPSPRFCRAIAYLPATKHLALVARPSPCPSTLPALVSCPVAVWSAWLTPVGKI
jgi:hypothetical protein